MELNEYTVCRSKGTESESPDLNYVKPMFETTKLKGMLKARWSVVGLSDWHNSYGGSQHPSSAEPCKPLTMLAELRTADNQQGVTGKDVDQTHRATCLFRLLPYLISV